MMGLGRDKRATVRESAKFCFAVLCWAVPIAATAQIIRDGTIGPGSNVQPSGPSYEVPESYGQLRGTNLFHSFSDFNVHRGESVTFTGRDAIARIISRVTGGTPSSIDGLLRSSIPNSDFYLINPRGVVFGPNAKLDVNGSLHVSTAKTLEFSTGEVFEATAGGQVPLLEVAHPTAFGLLGEGAAPIVLHGASLASRAGVELSAGDVEVRGGASLSARSTHGVTIRATDEVVIEGSTVVVESAGEDGVLSPRGVDIKAHDLHLADGGAIVTMTTGAASAGPIDVQVTGSVHIKGMRSSESNVELARIDSALPRASSVASVTTAGGDAGNISIAGFDIDLDLGRIITSVGGEATGGAGDIDVRARLVRIANGGGIESRTVGPGHGGDIRINASQIRLIGDNANSKLSSIEAPTRGAGDAGNVLITSDVLSMAGGVISADTKGRHSGDGGNIEIRASKLFMDKHFGQSGRFRFARIDSGSRNGGDGGDVLVVANDMDLRGESEIRARALAGGGAGNIDIETTTLRVFDGSRINAETSGAGLGGSVDVRASDQVWVVGDDAGEQLSTINSSSRGTADAGSVAIQALGVHVLGGEIASRASSEGDAGTITLTARNLWMGSDRGTEGQQGRIREGRISARATGSGHGGAIAINTSQLEMAGAAKIISSAKDGDGGDIVIAAWASAPLLSLTDAVLDRRSLDDSDRGFGGGTVALTGNSLVASRGEGSGDAGSIRIIGHDRLLLSDSMITTSSLTGEGGNIELDTRTLIALTNSEISTSASAGAGEGGRLRVSSEFVVLNGSRLLARADAGNAGKITVETRRLFASPDSVLDASANTGLDGVVSIETPEAGDDTGATLFPAEFLDVAHLLQPRCALAKGVRSEFAVSSLRGLPATPDRLLPAYDRRVATFADEPDRLRAATVGVLAAYEAEEAFEAGDFERSNTRWAKADEFYAERGGAKTARTDALLGLSQSQHALGRYGDAVGTLRDALALAESNGDTARVASALGGLGNALVAWGRPAAARTLLERGLAVSAHAGESGLSARIWNNLGNLRASRGALQGASKAYASASRLAIEVGDTLESAKALANAARVALEDGRLDAALPSLLEAGRHLSGLDETHEKAHVLIHLANSHEQVALRDDTSRAARLRDAHDLLQQAVSLSEELGDERILSYALGSLGELYLLERHLDEALYLTRRALRSAEAAQAPESLYRWHWQEGRLMAAQGNEEAAIASYRRAVRVLERSRQDSVAHYGTTSAHFRRLVAPVYLDLVDALLQSAERSDSPQSRLREARDTAERFKTAEFRNYLRDECTLALESRRQDLDTVSKSAAVVYPIFLPGRLEVLVSLPGGIARHTVNASPALVTARVRSLRAKLQDKRSSQVALRETAKQLYGWLVAPYIAQAQAAGIDTLVFVPDGVLRTIPMGALYDGRAFLAERYALAVTPSLTLIDPRPLPGGNTKVLLAGVTESVFGFPPLEHVSAELEAIQALYGGEMLIDDAFTLSRFEATLRDEALSVVHIATHGTFTGDADTSFVLAFDGPLSVDRLNHSISGAKYREQPLELLVLSACETAAGDDQAALGLAGIGIKAGARSALGSLWNVSDAATAKLLVAFYRALKSGGVSKASALRQAQKSLIEDERYAHPYFWSAFTLINNWL